MLLFPCLATGSSALPMAASSKACLPVQAYYSHASLLKLSLCLLPLPFYAKKPSMLSAFHSIPCLLQMAAKLGFWWPSQLHMRGRLWDSVWEDLGRNSSLPKRQAAHAFFPPWSPPLLPAACTATLSCLSIYLIWAEGMPHLPPSQNCLPGVSRRDGTDSLPWLGGGGTGSFPGCLLPWLKAPPTTWPPPVYLHRQLGMPRQILTSDPHSHSHLRSSYISSPLPIIWFPLTWIPVEERTGTDGHDGRNIQCIQRR